MPDLDYPAMLQIALEEARQGRAEGGIPIGAALFHRDCVGKRLAGGDPWKAEARNAVHIGGRSDSMPMNRGRDLQANRNAICESL